jgi:hypothetical protein
MSKTALYAGPISIILNINIVVYSPNINIIKFINFLKSIITNFLLIFLIII